MTSEDRRQARYLRRKAKRDEKRMAALKALPTYDEIFTVQNLYQAFWKCRAGVSWKPSIQMTQQNLVDEINKLLDQINSEQGFRSHGFIDFKICERGKMRHIRSVDIKERIVQRCFCDNYLVPLLTRSLIYDNGASLKGKGITFSIGRMQAQLQRYYRKYGTNEGYIFLYDFSKYFDKINHQKLFEKIDSLILDERCRLLYHHLVDVFGDVGLGLGSQISQVSAIFYPNVIDHRFQNLPYVQAYGRYMDDGYAICRTREDAEKLEALLNEWANEFCITINPKKIRISKISRTFTYLKKRFFLTDTGKVVIRLCRDNIYKHRRRIVKLLGLVDKGRLTIDDVWAAHRSWMGQANLYDNKKAVYNMDKQIRRLINGHNRANLSVNRRNSRAH